MEFTSDENTLVANAGISFIVDRLSQIHLDGGTQAFSSVCWTRVYERLREFISVFGLCELQFMAFA